MTGDDEKHSERANETPHNAPRERETRRSVPVLRIVEISALVLGALLIGLYLTSKVDSHRASKGAIDRFNQARNIDVSEIREELEAPGREVPGPVDTTLWSEGRIDGYQQSLLVDMDLPLAVLKVPRVDVEVPVFDGTDEVTLNRGAGRIEGTAFPGQTGNFGIAGHRDGFFRRLSDVSLGDTIIVETIDSTATYVIEDIRVVEPSDVWVLDPTDSQTITLVTCYPFYFVGSAPQRYIVRAALNASAAPHIR